MTIGQRKEKEEAAIPIPLWLGTQWGSPFSPAEGISVPGWCHGAPLQRCFYKKSVNRRRGHFALTISLLSLCPPTSHKNRHVGLWPRPGQTFPLASYPPLHRAQRTTLLLPPRPTELATIPPVPREPRKNQTRPLIVPLNIAEGPSFQERGRPQNSSHSI